MDTVAYYTAYDEDGRLERHRTEFVVTTYLLDPFIAPQARIIDVAAGTGIYSLYYAAKGCHVTALDITPKHIDMLSVKLAASPELNVATAVNDARNLSDYQTDGYDIVLCMGPVYHVEPDEVEACLQGCLRVLKPHGVLAVAYVNRYKGSEQDKYRDSIVFHTPEKIDQIVSGLGVGKCLNAPTDGPVFGALNHLVTQDRYPLRDLHAWLDDNRALFNDPAWPDTSCHGLYIGLKP